jgi:ABC-type sugar transport system ATPase subunit
MAVLDISGLAKSYGAVEALKGVDLVVNAGDVLALCGDNGAGKSTLIKIVSGAEQPSGGTIRLKGKPVAFASPHDALAKGIATIYQDLALAPRLSIAENVFLGAELAKPVLKLPFLSMLDKGRMRKEAATYLARLGVELTDLRVPVEQLSGGQRQAVAICRALRWNAELIILDEPTAALGVRETQRVLDLIRRLRDGGHTIILISHNMADVVAVASRVAILRGGRKIADMPTAGLDADRLAHMVMLGPPR